MSPIVAALIAAAEALLGIICWLIGSACGWRIHTSNGWEETTLLVLSCTAAQSVGLWLFTNARVRHAKRMGKLEGERKAWGEAVEMMEFVARVQSTHQRHETIARSRPAEKAN